MEHEKLIKKQFDILCKKCGSHDVEVTYLPGHEEYQCCYTGYFSLKCRKCEQEIWIDDDDE